VYISKRTPRKLRYGRIEVDVGPVVQHLLARRAAEKGVSVNTLVKGAIEHAARDGKLGTPLWMAVTGHANARTAPAPVAADLAARLHLTPQGEKLAAQAPAVPAAAQKALAPALAGLEAFRGSDLGKVFQAAGNASRRRATRVSELAEQLALVPTGTEA
jgi:hypothetical protein